MDPIALEDLQTPCLLLDEPRMARNVSRLNRHLGALGVAFRPHLKTLKSVEAARRVVPGLAGPICVSTLLEAERFAEAGARDILYAVEIAPGKLPRASALRARGVDLTLLVDGVEAARAVAAQARATADPVPALIEVDADNHRAGVRPDDAAALVAIADALRDGGAEARGVLVHAGGSYGVHGAEAQAEFAERERAAAVGAAAILRRAGHAAPVVSVGSTPTAHAARRLDGVTEVRAGVHVLQDLVMAGIGVCAVDDIALSVLATVIGHQRERGWILVDAGWMAMSRDRGTQNQPVDQGYGLACDPDGAPWPDLIMAGANQEHGILAIRPGSDAALPDLPVGSLVRILPNHACATAAQHDRYHVTGGTARRAHAVWDRFNGW